VSAGEHGSVELVEDYGPAFAPGPFELGTDGPRVIVVGVDGSRTASRAGAYAAGLARRQHSQLVIVYVAAPSSVWVSMTAGALAAAEEETHSGVVRELRELIRGRVDDLGVPVRFVVRRGDTFLELQHAATDAHADMVVVGASEQAGHRFVGSIAARLVRAARWPVTVVP
jgi:nucleotide-binding universal stress UspA family protein